MKPVKWFRSLNIIQKTEEIVKEEQVGKESFEPDVDDSEYFINANDESVKEEPTNIPAFEENYVR